MRLENDRQSIAFFTKEEICRENADNILVRSVERYQLIFYTQQINFMKLHNTLRATQNLLHLPALRQLIHQLI
jgi:hypothetical protein